MEFTNHREMLGAGRGHEKTVRAIPLNVQIAVLPSFSRSSMLADGRRLLQKGAHMKKLDARSRVTRRKVSSSKRQDSTAEMRQQLEDLSEKFDLVLPEVTARVAALEHLLREKQLVSRADLISARAFVRRLEE
jgi:hypothetical protein